MKRILATSLLSFSLGLLAQNNSGLDKKKGSNKPEHKTAQNKKTPEKTGVSKAEKALEKLEIGAKIPDLPENSNKLALVNDGGVWSQKDLLNKLVVLFYVAPSEKDLNRHVTDSIKKANLDKSRYSSYAVVNMKASSWPNWVLSWKLKQSQEEFASTTYVKDYERVLVDKWGLKDNSNDVVLIKNGKVLFVHKGKLPKEQTEQFVDLLSKEISLAKKDTKKQTIVAAKKEDKKTKA